MNETTDLIFYSNNNFSLGERIREYFRHYNKDVVYSNNLQQVIEKVKLENNVIIFIDKGHRNYVEMFSILVKSGLSSFDRVRVVFVDDDLSYYVDFVDNKKVFCIPTTNLKIAIQNIIYTCEILNYRKESINSALNKFGETISKYLIQLGFSFKLAGFRYIKQSVELGIKNNYSLGSLQKDIYPVVAQQNCTNSYNIERCIRMAIKSAALTEAFKKELNILSEREISNRLFLEFLLDKFRTE